jgi:DNA repair exonuclease SbcCD ATPase subunit
MGVVLKSLEWSNMFSYGPNNRLDLNKHKVTQLAAPNGSGKSSLALIIQELLYNKNVKGLKKSDILNRYNGAKSWEAKLKFSIDADEYELTSKRQGASTKVSIVKNGEDISEHKVLDTYKELSGAIGRDFETFSQLTYQSSTDLLEFLKATDTNRKKFLVNLFNLSKYLDIGEELKTLNSKREKDLASKQGELRTIEQFLSQNVLPEKATEKPLPIVDKTLTSQIEELFNRISSQKSICDSIDKNNLLIKERQNLTFNISLPEPTMDSSVNSKIESLKSEISETKSRLSQATKDLASLDIADHCYACKQPLDNSKAKELSDTLKEEISALDVKLKELRNGLNELVDIRDAYLLKVEQYNSNQKSIERFTQLSQLINTSLPKEYPDYKEISKQLKELENRLATEERELADTQKYNESVRIRNAKIDALKEQVRDFKARQELVNNDIVNIQDEITNLTILRKAFSTSGIVAYKLENVAKQLEDSINQYLAVLSDGQFQVLFRLSGDKLNIIVINSGEEVSIDSLSGGEFSRVQTSVLLAVRNTLSKIGGKSINLLFLDEITGTLDEAGKEKLFEVLQDEQNLNVFLISHDYSHPLIPKIEIEKNNNISTIRS